MAECNLPSFGVLTGLRVCWVLVMLNAGAFPADGTSGKPSVTWRNDGSFHSKQSSSPHHPQHSWHNAHNQNQQVEILSLASLEGYPHRSRDHQNHHGMHSIRQRPSLIRALDLKNYKDKYHDSKVRRRRKRKRHPSRRRGIDADFQSLPDSVKNISELTTPLTTQKDSEQLFKDYHSLDNKQPTDGDYLSNLPDSDDQPSYNVVSRVGEPSVFPAGSLENQTHFELPPAFKSTTQLIGSTKLPFLKKLKDKNNKPSDLHSTRDQNFNRQVKEIDGKVKYKHAGPFSISDKSPLSGRPSYTVVSRGRSQSSGKYGGYSRTKHGPQRPSKGQSLSHVQEYGYNPLHQSAVANSRWSESRTEEPIGSTATMMPRFVESSDGENKTIPEPSFLEDQKTEIHIHKGGVAILPCAVKHLDMKQVSWAKVGREHFLAIGADIWVRDARLSIVQGAGSEPEVTRWDLRIKDVMLEDEGVYKCQIISTEKRVHSVQLIVTELPPHNPVITMEGQKFVESGHTAYFRCNATEGNRTPTFMDWFKNGEQIDSTTEPRAIITNYRPQGAFTLVSELTVIKSQASDSAIYICRSTAGLIASMEINVLVASKTNVKRGGATGGSINDTRKMGSQTRRFNYPENKTATIGGSQEASLICLGVFITLFTKFYLFL